MDLMLNVYDITCPECHSGFTPDDYTYKEEDGLRTYRIVCDDCGVVAGRLTVDF